MPRLLRYIFIFCVGNLPKCDKNHFLSIFVCGILRFTSPSYFPRYCLADFVVLRMAPAAF